MTDQAIRPCRIDVPQADLDDLRERLTRTRWTSPAPDGGDYGVALPYVRRLHDRWLNDFDWRAWEARLNRYEQFETTIDGLRLHFLHVRSPRRDALPLILTHGWPGSVFEFIDVIEPLTRPELHGGNGAEAFHVVIPSLPGYGFSDSPRVTGWTNHRIAAAWRELMSRLGYTRYGAAGNDAGSMISPELGRIDGEHCVGVHVTQVFSFPSGAPAEMQDLTADEMSQLQTLQWFFENKFSFNTLLSQQPQTIAYALDDSPVGLLAWNAQLLGEDLDDDFALANLSLYWLSRSGGSAGRLYYENAHVPHASGTPTTMALGLAGFGGDFYGLRRFAQRDHANIVHWNTYDRGGHFAAFKAPDLYVPDVRAFFRMVGR